METELTLGTGPPTREYTFPRARCDPPLPDIGKQAGMQGARDRGEAVEPRGRGAPSCKARSPAPAGSRSPSRVDRVRFVQIPSLGERRGLPMSPDFRPAERGDPPLSRRARDGTDWSAIAEGFRGRRLEPERSPEGVHFSGLRGGVYLLLTAEGSKCNEQSVEAANSPRSEHVLVGRR